MKERIVKSIGLCGLAVAIFSVTPVAVALPIPVSSSIEMKAEAEIISPGSSGLITDTDSVSQGGTINPLSVSVNALATFANSSILATGQGFATWIDSSQGSVTFANVGWKSIDVNSGSMNIFRGRGWTYEFIADETGLFTLDYDINGVGSDTFGLNGFFFHVIPNGNFTLQKFTLLDVNTAGMLTHPIIAGNTYSMTIRSQANIAGGIETRDALMTGLFNWTTRSVASPVPEPATLVMVPLALGALSLAIRRRGAIC